MISMANSGRMRRLMNRLAVDLEASAAVVLVAAIRLRASISVISVQEVAVSAASSKISSVVVAAGGAGGFGGFGGFGGNAGADFGAGGCNGGCGGNARHSTGEMNMNVNIDMYTALLGGEGIVKLSNGSKIKLKIKPETQNGTKVRVRGKGYDRGDGTFGDLIITYNVKLPTGLTERQKELLKEMKEAK